MAQDIFSWWLAIQLLGLAGMPAAGLLLGSLPDRGYAYAKSLGLLFTGYLAWLLAMLGLAPFGAGSLLVTALALAGVGVWMRGGPRALWTNAAGALRTRWPAILASEAVFLCAMLAVVWMRAHDPTPWGTERPMDFAFFNAIQRSGLFPPNDPWLSGFSLNYYYFGYLLMAAMAMLTGVAPGVAYNLALALIFALTAQGIAGTIANLMTLAGAGHGRPSRVAYILFPLLGVVFVLVAGNQSGAIQLAAGDERAVALDAGELSSALRQAAGGASTITLPEPVQTPGDAFGTFSSLERQDKAASFNWWWPSRSLWDTYPNGERRYTITEFPLFSFRLGDMHPHVMGLPFGLLAAATALAALARPALPWGSRHDTALLLLSGLVLGSLYTINSWDLPAYLLLYLGALVIVARRDELPRYTVALPFLVVLAAAYTLFLPFHLTFRSLVGGAEPLLDLPVLGRLTSIIGLYSAERSSLLNFLVIFGLFFVPLLLFVYLARTTEPQAPGTDRADPSVLGLTAGAATFSLQPASFLLLLPPLLFLAGLLVGFPLLMLAGLGLLALDRALHLAERPAESFALLVTALGCSIIFGVELIYIRDVFEGWSARFNTVFKFYYQVWLLWGTLAPFALWWVLQRTSGVRRPVAWGASALTAVLLAGALVFPWLTLRDLGRGDLVGLDGRTPREQTAAGRASVEWLRQHAAPGSVVLEAVALDNAEAVELGSAAPRCGGSYNGEGYAGIAAATGLPTVLGWHGHQLQWRGGDQTAMAQLDPRCADVDTLFRSTNPDQARQLLATYDVDYVYLGDLERRRYAPEALGKFSQLGTAVFEQDEVTIYQVRQP